MGKPAKTPVWVEMSERGGVKGNTFRKLLEGQITLAFVGPCENLAPTRSETGTIDGILGRVATHRPRKCVGGKKVFQDEGAIHHVKCC